MTADDDLLIAMGRSALAHVVEADGSADLVTISRALGIRQAAAWRVVAFLLEHEQVSARGGRLVASS